MSAATRTDELTSCVDRLGYSPGTTGTGDGVDILTPGNTWNDAYRLWDKGHRQPPWTVSPTSVYLAWDGSRLLYVGITASGSTRYRRHAKESEWWYYATRLDLIHYPTRELGEIAELWYITHWQPAENGTWAKHFVHPEQNWDARWQPCECKPFPRDDHDNVTQLSEPNWWKADGYYDWWPLIRDD